MPLILLPAGLPTGTIYLRQRLTPCYFLQKSLGSGRLHGHSDFHLRFLLAWQLLLVLCKRFEDDEKQSRKPVTDSSTTILFYNLLFCLAIDLTASRPIFPPVNLPLPST